MSRTRRSFSERERLVREWDGSGLTAEQFSQSRGINAEMLRRWGRAVRGAIRTRSLQRPIPRSVELVELVAAPTEAPQMACEARIELFLTNGRRLALFGDVAVDRLSQIVAALERT